MLSRALVIPAQIFTSNRCRSLPACGLRRGERLIRSAEWRWHDTDHRTGDIDEDDESSGPRRNWRDVSPCRSGRASSGAVVGKSRHRRDDPGRFEGFDNRSPLAWPLASSSSLLAPLPLVIWSEPDSCEPALAGSFFIAAGFLTPSIGG
jgi:hypothetical protein